MESTEGNYHHDLFSDPENGSPEYQRTLARWGRWLSPTQVEDILRAHSFTVDEMLGDLYDPILGGAEALPERLDAGNLYAWLGY